VILEAQCLDAIAQGGQHRKATIVALVREVTIIARAAKYLSRMFSESEPSGFRIWTVEGLLTAVANEAVRVVEAAVDFHRVVFHDLAAATFTCLAVELCVVLLADPAMLSVEILTLDGSIVDVANKASLVDTDGHPVVLSHHVDPRATDCLAAARAQKHRGVILARAGPSSSRRR
jgi:hypothetical protein